MVRFHVPTALGALALILAAGPLTAQAVPRDAAAREEEELLQLLNTPVSGASKREQRLMDSPQAIEVLTGDELRAMGVQRLQDALKLMTGLDILEPDNGYSVVGMRGVMQQGQPRTVQVLVDGVPLYNAFASSIDINNLPVPIEMVERVEVVRGPCSTLYGANAVVGVIAITTRKGAKDVQGGARMAAAGRTARWGADLSGGTGGFGFSAGASGASLGNTGRVAYDVGDTGRTYPQRLDGSWRPNQSHQSSAMARLDWTGTSSHLWATAGQASKTLGQSQGLVRRWYDVQTFSLGWRETWSPVLATEVRASQVGHKQNFRMDDEDAALYQSAIQLMQLPAIDISGDQRLGDVTTRQVEVQANLDPASSLHFVMGVDARRVHALKSPFLGLKADDTETAGGGFLTVDWTFAPQWTLSAGGRVENETLGGSRNSPRATLVWTPTPTSVLRAGYFTSTRSPQLMEQRVDYNYPYSNDLNPATRPPLHLTMCQILPNPQLKPEKTSNFEIGYRQALGAFTMDLTLYRMKIASQITQVVTKVVTQSILIPFPPPYPPLVPEDVPVYVNQFQNLGDATNQGVELALTWSPRKHWTAGFNGRYLDYKQDDASNGLAALNGSFSYAPKHLLTAWTRFSSGRFSGYLDVQHIGATQAEALTATGVNALEARAAYVQVDVQGRVEILPHVSLGAYARNAARKDTLQGASGPDRPPLYQTQRREVGLTVTSRF